MENKIIFNVTFLPTCFGLKKDPYDVEKPIRNINKE